MYENTAQRMLTAMKTGKVYRAEELLEYSNNLSRDLTKLVEDESLVKAAPGLYYRPAKSRFGPQPADERELVKSFLKDGDFLLLSFNDYNVLGVGLTQLYNHRLVYNRKRRGTYKLDGRTFTFQTPRDYPKKLSEEFLFVDLLNNQRHLAEDTSSLLERTKSRVGAFDLDRMVQLARRYGKVATRKFFEEVCA